MMVTINYFRTYDHPAPYLATIGIWPEFATSSGGNIFAAFPQCRGVMDDYGTLVFVERWK